jgi:hypothetical protein
LARKLSDVRADYLEAEVERQLRIAFPEAQFATQFKWQSGGQEFETDILLRFDTTLLLVEAKSGKVSWSACVPGTLRAAMRGGHTFRGITGGDSDPDVFIPELIEHDRAGRFPCDLLVKTYRLSDINRAIADQHDGVCVKPVLLAGGVEFLIAV